MAIWLMKSEPDVYSWEDLVEEGRAEWDLREIAAAVGREIEQREIDFWEADGTVPLGGILIMMSADIVLYGLLAYYLDNVLPTEYGTRRKPWFPFQLSFWVSET